MDSGATVLGADLFLQGEFLKEGRYATPTRVVANPREAPCFTFGYNHSLFAQRTHDVLMLVKFLRAAKVGSHPSPTSVSVAGLRGAGPVVAAARAVSGDAIDRAAVDTGGFRFGRLLDYRDPQFLPGGAKYLDLPCLLALGAPHPLWLAGEGDRPEFVTEAYRLAGQPKNLAVFSGEAGKKKAPAAEWLIK